MSAFNILTTEIECSNCHNFYTARIQYKYGDVWQLEYKLGDKVAWGGNDIGIPQTPGIKTLGTLEEEICPICNQVNVDDEFDIFIENDIITSMKKMNNIKDYSNPDNYFIELP